jgi:hypothetical protein
MQQLHAPGRRAAAGTMKKRTIACRIDSVLLEGSGVKEPGREEISGGMTKTLGVRAPGNAVAGDS